MLEPIFEGKLDIFLKSDVEMTEGQLVVLDPKNEDKIVIAQAGEDVYGIVAQNVVPGDVNNFKLDSVTSNASVGDKVGVYFGDGLYYTDQTGTAVAYNDELYAGADGQLVTGGSGNAVAVAHGTAEAGEKVKIRKY